MRMARLAGAGMALLLSGCMFAVAPQTFEKPYARSGSEVRKAMAAALESGDKAALTRRAIELAWMGGTLSDATLARIAPSLDPGAFSRARVSWLAGREPPLAGLKRRFAANAMPNDEPEPFAQVPAEYRLVEGIAWDEKTQRLFVGTVIEGRLAYRDRDGSWHEVPVGSPRGGLFGMAVDAERRLLWIATGSVEETAVAGERMTGLIAVDLETLRVVRRVPLAAGAAGAAGDLVIAADGTVYVSNVLSGAIHRCRPGCTVLEDFLPAGTFPNPQGLAVSANGKRLYIADYLSGLWVVDPRTGAKVPIRIGEPLMLEGIDGLVITHNNLVAIQNGTRPRRIVRFLLDRDGDRILETNVRATVAPEAGDPTLGVNRAATGEMFVVGDGQWERYGPGGVLKDGAPLRPTPILQVAPFDDIII
ncbi:hypothetical protein OF829_11240 [Sphingomonas sp. LB-2]|uniref:SMP-30/gluconolactonase/LRE family protein n=1 Tax=Sphingomonas caeni TaxID=2984949 RepID=UPI0022310CE2|nr:hypothetical protein [Sphingomonas caeni]MCW3847814.1 hypothetical protein [Sphingomonas caeni]